MKKLLAFAVITLVIASCGSASTETATDSTAVKVDTAAVTTDSVAVDTAVVK